MTHDGKAPIHSQPIQALCKLLAIYLKNNYYQATRLNKLIRIFVKKPTQHGLICLKTDPQAKALTLEYLQSFQVIQDVLQSNTDVECLEYVQHLFLELHQ